MIKKDNHLHILGGGPAGMALSYFALNKHIPFKLIEATNQVGGNCKTIIEGEFKFDTGAHRLHDKNNYTIILNPDDGDFYYAEKIGDKLRPSIHKVGIADPIDEGVVRNYSKASFLENHCLALNEIDSIKKL